MMKSLRDVGAGIGGWNLGIMFWGNFEFFIMPTVMQGFIIGSIVWAVGVAGLLVAGGLPVMARKRGGDGDI